ncbi:DUF2459 domain-containing protein [Altererythrobacter arenosus]|uniref:DUF2459 domain-containing protein n=1 Tax=Altererythrobacter arenosus TaxID=3032592 RepID=A0ABY8FV22_9SPHN|nr:DUF2459 domain-containing protein [Altererythrobacter sp. CAU 1644]WFL77251.1 DUF2459 domain-containing protein [Altererythrobacter sp. CAU 1644]
MAEEEAGSLIWAKRLVLLPLAALVALAALFFLSAWIGSSIPRNGDWQEPADGIEIMVGTNGVHTELVLPIVTPVKDWRADFPTSDIPAAYRPYTHVAVSWGEREVFLNTPTWADLTLSTALGAATGGDSLLHVAHYVRPAPSDDFRPLRLTEAQYARLVAEIEHAILAPAARKTYPGYAEWDVFYDAPGTYHLGKTCNQWTSDTLAAAGVKTGWWTPMTGGVMKWVPAPSS